MWLNFINKHHKLVISKSGKSHHKIVKLEVKNFEHLSSNNRTLHRKAVHLYTKSAYAHFSPKKRMALDGWMVRKVDGWMDGWLGGRAGLRIAYSNQKYTTKKYLVINTMKLKMLIVR